MVDVLGTARQGAGLGADIRSAVDARKAAGLQAKQQELVGGLRRQSLGLGGESKQEQFQAQKELLATDPEQYKAFQTQIESLSDPDIESLKERNDRIGLAAANLLEVPDEDLAMATTQTARAFQDRGEPELAAQAMELAQLAQTNPQEARQRLSALQTQAREIEDVIASNEKLRKEQADLSQKELDNKLKSMDNAFDQIGTLRKDVETKSKEFNKVKDAFNRVEAVFDTNAQAKSAADMAARIKTNNPEAAAVMESTQAFGDMALIFNFMKILDPGSTVREGEFANAENTGGVDDKTRNLYNKLLNGQRLTPEQREGLRAQAQGLFKKSQNQNDKDMEKYRKTAKTFGLPEDQIFDVREGTVVEGIEELSPEEQAELQALESEFGGQ